MAAGVGASRPNKRDLSITIVLPGYAIPSPHPNSRMHPTLVELFGLIVEYIRTRSFLSPNHHQHNHNPHYDHRSRYPFPTSVIIAISGGAPTLMGGPHVPAPMDT